MLCRLLLGALAALLPSAPGAGAATPPLRLERKIPLPDVHGRIDHLSVDPVRRRLFVAALGNDTVTLVVRPFAVCADV